MLVKPQTKTNGQSKVGSKCVDEDGSSNIHNSKDIVADIEIDDTEDGLQESHEQQLEGVDFPNDDTEADEDSATDETRLDDINEADLDGKLLGGIHLDEAEDDEGELGDDDGDDHGEAQ